MRYFDLGLKKMYVCARAPAHRSSGLHHSHGIESKVQKQLREDKGSESGAGYYGKVRFAPQTPAMLHAGCAAPGACSFVFASAA